jgi:ATP-dependent DNA helicase DinG
MSSSLIQEISGIDVNKALSILEPAGPLSTFLKGYEARKEQQHMMRDIIDAYNGQKIALIEAGTGTGKSMAYLIPAILWALKNNERTVISTNTIALQEQLLLKDIPLVLKALNVDIKAVLVKGMSNYLCMRKLDEALQELRLFPSHESEEINKIEAWSNNTKEGSRSDLPFTATFASWDKVCAENDTCARVKCSYYEQCHFFKARKHAADAQLLIVNHHMLFSDLSYRAEENNYEDTALLPQYRHVILDEAHNIEDIATEHFASRISEMQILRVMGRLAAEKQQSSKTSGKLPLLKEKIAALYKENTPNDVSSILTRLTVDIPGTRRDLQKQIIDTFQYFSDFLQSIGKQQSSNEDTGAGESKLRLLPQHHTHPIWNTAIIPQVKNLTETIMRYLQSLNSIEKDIKILENEKLNEQTKGIRFEITALVKRLEGFSEILLNFISKEIPLQSVRWIEAQKTKTLPNIHLIDAELEISQRLVNFLFTKFPTIILCSATLTTNNKFEFFRQRLGITQKYLTTREITENIYDSPFNFTQQALLVVPANIPNPSEPGFIAAAAESIWKCIQTSRGNAFVLFTSYSMLNTCHQILAKRLEEHRFNLLKQGDSNRHYLLNKFKSIDRSILFGTDSFWEGVDVVGDALRCVIIVKLPFKVPSEPIIQARTEAISARGGDPFSEYSLPNAIVKFKQGFGRLIRNKRDRGCIVCLDTRLINKRYGKMFLESLPKCQQFFAEEELIREKMSDFYKKTYFLTLPPKA